MSKFASLLRRADTLRRIEPDPIPPTGAGTGMISRCVSSSVRAALISAIMNKMKTRCDYCANPATVVATYYGYLARRGPGNPHNHSRITIGACADHVGCPGWVGMLTLHPEAKMVNRASRWLATGHAPGGERAHEEGKSEP